MGLALPKTKEILRREAALLQGLMVADIHTSMATSAAIQRLTERQKEVLRLLLNGHRVESAGRKLGISAHTVTEHLRGARRRLGVSSSREAARLLRLAETNGGTFRPDLDPVSEPGGIGTSTA